MNKLDDRLKKILRIIVQSHIDLNAPIGSILIAKKFPVGLSPATIRNTMAKLEKLGYITQPHTSAGRVPTGKGYRFYVDSLLYDQTVCGTSISSELAVRFGAAKKDNTALVKEAA
jgi:heat-inducible transcriptional repressor